MGSMRRRPRLDVAPRDLRAAVPGLRACTRGESRACASHTRDAAAYSRFARVVMRATRTVVTPGRSNRVVGRIDSCLSGVIPPVEGKRTVRESVWEIPSSCTPVCTPLARATNFRFSRPRFRISGDEISLRGAPPLASARFPFGAEREPLAHHGAAAEPAPDRARARRTHGRARSRGRSARRSRGSSRGARGRTRPGGPEIRREPGTSWLRSRRSRGVPLGFS